MNIPRLHRLDDARVVILNAIGRERHRQNALKASGKFKHTPDEVSVSRGLLMLAEEFGEACKADLELSGDVEETPTTVHDLYTELIHVAATAAAMAEGMAVRLQFTTRDPRITDPYDQRP